MVADNTSLKRFVCIAVCALFLGSAESASSEGLKDTGLETTNSTVVFWGGNIKERAFYGYAGTVHAFNGDLSQDGLLLRGVIGYGAYEYDTGSVVGGEVDGEVTQFDATIGYQVFRGASRLSGYVGINYQDHDLSPIDLTNSTRGDEIGFLVQGEIETIASHSFYASMIANYSTANDTFWARARVGKNVGHITIGPEATLMGNKEYDGRRIGAFIGGLDLGSVNASISGGYADVDGTQGDSGAYGAIGFSIIY